MDLRTRPKLNYLVPIVYPTPPRCVKLRTLEACEPAKGDLKYRKSTILHLQKMYAKYKLLNQVSSLGDAESSLGDAKRLLGDAESSLGDAKSSLGDAESSLGDAKSSLGDA
jgi:hypothetical protein